MCFSSNKAFFPYPSLYLGFRVLSLYDTNTSQKEQKNKRKIEVIIFKIQKMQTSEQGLLYNCIMKNCSPRRHNNPKHIYIYIPSKRASKYMLHGKNCLLCGKN